MAPETPELRQQQLLRRSRSVDVDLHGPRAAAPGHRQLEDRTPKALLGGQQRRPDGLSGHDGRHRCTLSPTRFTTMWARHRDRRALPSRQSRAEAGERRDRAVSVQKQANVRERKAG